MTRESQTREADILDEAGKLTQTLTNASIANVQDAAAPEQQRNADGTWPRTTCAGPFTGDECGEDIPEGRLALGKIRCIECQTMREQVLAARARS